MIYHSNPSDFFFGVPDFAWKKKKKTKTPQQKLLPHFSKGHNNKIDDRLSAAVALSSSNTELIQSRVILQSLSIKHFRDRHCTYLIEPVQKMTKTIRLGKAKITASRHQGLWKSF